MKSFLSPGPLDAMLRGLVLGKLGRCGEEKTVEEAKKRYKAHIERTKTLAADLRSAVCIEYHIE